jgi:hypothetical protein
MSDINLKGCVLFEEELVQKIVVIQYTLVNNTSSNEMDLKFNLYLAIKIIVLSIGIYLNV